MKIDWQRVVLNLRNEGLSGAAIARKIQRDESVIQRIARGESKRVGFEEGLALLDLHHDLCPTKHQGIRHEKA